MLLSFLCALLRLTVAGLLFRLNKQHLLLTEVVNNQLIHESIPRDRIQAVADVATGTGFVYLSVCVSSD